MNAREIAEGLDFPAIVRAITDAGYGSDIEWSEKATLPETPDEFAAEAIFVIANSGMHYKAGRTIFDRVMAELRIGGSAHTVFGHMGKASAMNAIWRDRVKLHLNYPMWDTPEKQLAYCESLPWIGRITKYHLAKNFGANVAKPDRHLQRLADSKGCTPQELCDNIAAETGYRAATIDVVLWRACAVGIIDSTALEQDKDQSNATE